MFDLNHTIGGDLSLTGSGGLTSVTGTLRGQQRILRRLFTNPGDYIWEPTYGAGVAAKIGTPMNIPEIKALILSQILLEQAVARTPAPQVTVKQLAAGSYQIRIVYIDANTGTQQVLTFDPSNPPGQASST